MSKKKNKQPAKAFLPGWIPVRDPLIVALINGATKGGIQKDRKKEANRKACRGAQSIPSDHQ
jgi:hypothetical protein